MRILGVDPGEINIGLAISDPSGTIANPFGIIKHVSRDEDALAIAQTAVTQGVSKIIVGQALGAKNEITYQSRNAARLANAIRKHTGLPVELWDESGSTQEARQAAILLGGRPRKRRGHLDDIAATVILQSYLDRFIG